MTGQTITELMYLMAIPVQGDLKRVQVFCEDGFMFMRCVGIYRIDIYEKMLQKRNFTKIQEHCKWDEAFSGWKTPISMRNDIEKPVLNTSTPTKTKKAVTSTRP
jgi:hypothetical protein